MLMTPRRFFGLRAPNATTAAPPETITSAETQPVRQYKKSGLDDEMLDTYEHSIRGFMQQSRIYLEPELSLEELSEQARIPKHHVTQLLNERLHKNFYAFINEYRIEEAMNKLKDPAHANENDGWFNDIRLLNGQFQLGLGYPF